MGTPMTMETPTCLFLMEFRWRSWSQLQFHPGFMADIARTSWDWKPTNKTWGSKYRLIFLHTYNPNYLFTGQRLYELWWMHPFIDFIGGNINCLHFIVGSGHFQRVGSRGLRSPIPSHGNLRSPVGILSVPATSKMLRPNSKQGRGKLEFNLGVVSNKNGKPSKVRATGYEIDSLPQSHPMPHQ